MQFGNKHGVFWIEYGREKYYTTSGISVRVLDNNIRVTFDCYSLEFTPNEIDLDALLQCLK